VNETIYVYTRSITKYLDIFADNISIDNPIDQNLNIDFSICDINVKFNNNKVVFYKNIKPHRYADDKEEKVLAKLDYTNSMKGFDNRANSIEHLIDFNNFISKDVTDIIDDERFCMYSNTAQKNILQSKVINKHINIDNISAQITRTTVKNNGNIILHIEADNIIHEKDLEYTFENPMDKKSKFLKFIDYLGIKSLDELELQPITLSQEPDKVSLDVNGFYINKTINNKQDNMQKSKSIVNQVISIIT